MVARMRTFAGQRFFQGIGLVALAFLSIQVAVAQEAAAPALNPMQVTAQPPPDSSQPVSLALFGRSFFANPSARDMQQAGVTAAPSYVLGAGDRIGIHLGGKAQQNFETVVTSDGQIYLPTVGVLPVQGLTMAHAKTMLDSHLRRLYANYTLDVVLISPKMVRVAVVGDVMAPGNYALSALNTVLDAVAQAQGPSDRGSLRDIQIFRADGDTLHVDLYDYLLKPGSAQDVFLQGGDRVFVAPSRCRVQIEGEVHRPAIYELAPRSRERLDEILELAGGLTDIAFKSKIELSRLQGDGSRSITYYDFQALQDSALNPLLANNDHITVYSIMEQYPRQVVSIQGEVNKPGVYDWEENLKLSDLILKAGSLTRSAYLQDAEVAQVQPNKPAQVYHVDLRALFQGLDAADIVLSPDDQVFIRRIPDWQVGPLVEVRGEVMFPGYYPIVEDTTRLSEVLDQCGGFTRDALISEAKLIRRREAVIEDKEYERLRAMSRDEMSKLEYDYLVMKQNSSGVNEIVIDFNRLVKNKDANQDIVLRDGDVIIVPKTPRVVMVTGRVARPGGVMYKPGAGLKYYLAQAGGHTWDADGRHTKIIKAAGDILDDEDVDVFWPGDRIWVPRKPDRNYWQLFRDTILVVGQVAAIFLVIQNAKN